MCDGDELELVDLSVVVGRHEVDGKLQVEDELGLREDSALRFEEKAEKKSKGVVYTGVFEARF